MHLLYVDESGDPGVGPHSSQYFILCGLLVHHAEWHRVQSVLCDMRARLHHIHGLLPEAELHACEFLGSSRDHLGLSQRQRIQSLLHVLGCLHTLDAATPVRVVIDKAVVADNPVGQAWAELMARVVQQIGGAPRHALCTADGLVVVCDDHRPSPGSRWLKAALSNLPELRTLLIDLPFGRESHDSQLLQLCDLLSFLTKQSIAPNRFFTTSAGKALLHRYHRYCSGHGLRDPGKE